MSSSDHLFGGDLRERISDNLDSHQRLTVDEPELRQAAVAITIGPMHPSRSTAERDGRQAGFILTRRSDELRAHAGQYALPGGRIDPGESRTEAARRELYEEVGVDAPAHAVLGLLDDYRTRSGYVITPVVVWLDQAVETERQQSEVAEIHLINLYELDSHDSPRWLTIEESERKVLQLPIRDRLIHAPTGALLYQFREVCLWGRLVRTDSIEEPVFAWR